MASNALRSNVSYASLPLFVPTIISEMGAFSSIQSQGLSAPPYILSFLTILLFCYLSDKFQVRGPFCFAGAMLGAIGFIINATTTGAAPRYFAIFLSVEIFASVAILLAWVSNIHATESRRAGAYTVLGFVGQCGPLLGQSDRPSSSLHCQSQLTAPQAPTSFPRTKCRTIARVCGSAPPCVSSWPS